ncbi:MAG: LysR family transcriptional regulator, partial [Gallionellaceae bacterium]|nr:LysR family transcriptional regulator [Gallionellaceae bacterium]
MLHLTLRQLQVFEAAARHLSFSRAAKELHLSQPGVSMQIKQLEEAIGRPLFEQLGKKLFLTEVGREVQRASQAIAQQLVDLADTLDDLRGLKQGALTVGVVSTVSNFAIRLISQFRQEHPEVRITLNVVNRETLLEQLANNEVDLALMGQPPAGHDLESTPFMENPLLVIAPLSHPLAKQKNIPLTRIAEEDFVAREPGSGTRSATEAFFQSHGLALRAAMEMNKNEAIKQAVESGLGLGVVSRHTVTLELAALRLVALDVE